MLRYAKLVFFLSLIFILLLPTNTTKADVAPPPIPGLGSLEPFEYQQTNVQMVYERVEMELMYELIEEEPQEFYRTRIKVNAWFVLKNQGSQEEAMQVVFPLDNMNECFWSGEGIPSYTYLDFLPESFFAWVDGTPVEVSNIRTDHPHKDDQGHCEDEKMTWAAFEIQFPPGKDVVVKVQYILDGGGDATFQMMYVLETGRGWKGPIKAGHIVFRFPYMVEDNILKGTSPDFQTLYNEIYWSINDLEPSEADNIVVVAISPDTWNQISESRVRVQRDPADVEAWMQLVQSYNQIGHWHGPNIRNKFFSQRAFYVLNQALEKNPDSSELYTLLAELTWNACCYYTPPPPDDGAKLLSLLQRALQRDPTNQEARKMLAYLLESVPDLEYTPLPTFVPSPTPTASITASPTITATVDMTKRSRGTNTPEVISPATKTNSAPTLHPVQFRTPVPTSSPIQASLKPSETALTHGQRDQGPSGGLIIGLFGAGILVAGLVASAFWRKKKIA